MPQRHGNVLTATPPRWSESAGAPRVLVHPACWSRLVAELDRVSPCEGLAVPLVALLRRAAHNPCASIELAELDALVIARIVLVPGERQLNAPLRVGVVQCTDDVVNARIAAELRRFPRLRACAYLHSHPFARGTTRPSGTDIEGHMVPLLRHNRDAQLNAAFSFIACRAEDGRGWRLHGFALDAGGGVVELGPAALAGDASLLHRLLLPPLARRAPFRHLLRRWRRELRRAGLRHRTDEVFDGWVRTVVTLAEGRRAVILVPLDFPLTEPRVFVVHRGDTTARPVTPRRPTSLAPDAWLSVVRQIEEESHDAA